MKITIYTINDCTFSQQEKEYLKLHNMEFEEKNLEVNRDFLTEMLSISNNFAGTPVTQIEKDTGEKMVLKGFTSDEFDKALGLSSVVPAQEPVISVPEVPVAEAVPVAEQAPAVEPVVVESLSQDTSNVSVTPSDSMMPPILTEEPAPPIQSVSPEPISLDVTETPAAPVTPAEPMQQPVVQTAEPAPAPMPQQTTPDALNSVLQNLQSQVGEAEKKPETPPTPVV